MRISPINNFNHYSRYNRNISFGVYRKDDDNARRVTRQTLENSYLDKEDVEYYIETLENEKHFEIFTDEKTAKVKCQTDGEYEKNEKAASYINSMKDDGIFDDLSELGNIKILVRCMENCQEILDGNDPFAYLDADSSYESPYHFNGHDSYAAMRAEEEAYHG